MEDSNRSEDAAMIQSILRKMCDDMDGLEADRIMPAHKKPGYSAGSMGVEKPAANVAETPEEAEPENQDNQHEALDPDILKALMEKADQADESGSLPEDNYIGLPPAIADAVRKKKGMK